MLFVGVESLEYRFLIFDFSSEVREILVSKEYYVEDRVMILFDFFVNLAESKIRFSFKGLFYGLNESVFVHGEFFKIIFEILNLEEIHG